MTTMELEARKAGFIRQVLTLDNEETMSKLERYLKKMMQRAETPIAPMMHITSSQFERHVQEAVDDDDIASDEELTQFYGRWESTK